MLMPRVMGVFAKRGIVPSQMHSGLNRPQSDDCEQDIHIDIQIKGLSQFATVRLAEDLRQIVGVVTVLTSQKHHIAAV